ncbi:DNA mismatch repair protein MSH5 [Camellia lanceoleosa]|uniref:DNA mismatch repair protein MSH5 n=1 Tax=Camellia lanceoleosa TaxID=1840588 RepID=A0ACC0IE70_9ERIC|nr:DNA mismatch repair protein MSH5 [Camellia lanceoleosa]
MADSIPDGWHEENEIGKNGKEIKVALIVFLSHIGCFVPANVAPVGLSGRIFCAMGSKFMNADQSKFMIDLHRVGMMLSCTAPSLSESSCFCLWCLQCVLPLFGEPQTCGQLLHTSLLGKHCLQNYTPLTVGASQGRKKQRLNPPKVRKQAEKAAAGKQCSKDLMHASNQSHEESDNPEEVSLPGELPKKVCHDMAPN